jgi:hypothetical protein
MRTIVHLIAFAWIGCTAQSPAMTVQAVQPSAVPLQLFRMTDGKPTLTIQMTPDDRLRDGSGAVLGTFDATSGLVAISGVTITLSDVVRVQNDRQMELRLPIGRWLVDVAADRQVRVNGERWGQVEGFFATPQAWQRLEALFAALPAMPSRGTVHKE